jgi:hypothetical protein
VYDTAPRFRLCAPDLSGAAGRPRAASRVPARQDETARSIDSEDRASCSTTPPSNSEGARQLRHFAQLRRLAVRAEWRRGVGRQARQSGGGILLNFLVFFENRLFKTVQVSCTPFSSVLVLSIEDYRTASLFE